MAETTGINWTDSTFNPWIGCTKISPACDSCYAEALMDTRHHRVRWGGARSRTSASNWQEPHRWQKKAAEFFSERGRRRRVFCASLADVFDNQVPDEWRSDLWQMILECPDIDWLLLTKRPQNIAKMKPTFWDDVKGHVWLGTTVEDQEHADQNIPHLLQHDSAVRFLSCEPLLGPIDLNSNLGGTLWIGGQRGCGGTHRGIGTPECPRHLHHHHDDRCLPGIDWVISGGESGSHARPTHPQWFRDLRDQCAAAGIPYLHKQNGEWVSVSEVAGDGKHFSFEDGATVRRVGKKTSGRTIDGVVHDGFPGDKA